MASGISLFNSLGIEAGRVGCGAESGIEILLFENSGGPRLFANLGGKVDLVVRRSDTGAENYGEIARICPEGACHEGDSLPRDIEFCALLSGMEKGEGSRLLIQKIDCAAVGDMNAEEYPGLFGEESIGSECHFRRGGINNRKLITMDLLGEMGGIEAQGFSSFSMRRLQEGESGLLIS